MSGGDVKPFPVLLAEAIARQKLTVIQVHNRTGISVSQIYRYLEGESIPRTRNLKRLATVLKIPSSRLAQSFLVEAAGAEAEVLASPEVDVLQARIGLLEKELNQRRLENGEPPLDFGDSRILVEDL